jgi:hypothetical protein
MKRDMNLIRLLLLETEGEEPKPDLSPYSGEQRVYHSALLIEAGLIDGQIIPNAIGLPARTVSLRLTWSGHEFLDATRSGTKRASASKSPAWMSRSRCCRKS